jgi:hypothetical protein
MQNLFASIDDSIRVVTINTNNVSVRRGSEEIDSICNAPGKLLQRRIWEVRWELKEVKKERNLLRNGGFRWECGIALDVR